MSEEYLGSFLSEANEMVTELNNSLLELESDPNNKEAMDKIFRTAHTLKGNFRAMGFQDPSDLAHAIEDLLDEVRDGNIGVDQEVMDSIFEGIDEIDRALDELERDGEIKTDPSDLVDEIRGFIEEKEDQVQETGGADGSKERPKWLGELEKYSDSVVLAELVLEDSQMPGIDAQLVLKSIDEDGFELVDSEPSREEIEDGSFDDGFELLIDLCEKREDELSDFLSDKGKIKGFDLINLEEVEETKRESKKEKTKERRDEDRESSEEDSGGDVGSVGSVDKIQSVRVNVDQIDTLMNRVKELVISRMKIKKGVEDKEFKRVEKELKELDKISTQLQNTIMDMRLVPLKKVVNRFPRMVRDLATQQDKKIDFTIRGEDIELDRTILNQISDPLMHVIRNSVDHGIESPEERKEMGKPERGKIELRGKRERNKAIIEVEDDGRGIDADAVKEKAINQKMISEEEAEEMSDERAYKLIFESGFSTKEEVTDVSGRGVGMDVVSNTVENLDGSIEVESEVGEGTLVKLSLPFSVSIARVLLTRIGEERFGIPVKHLEKVIKDLDTEKVEGKEITRYQDTTYPILDLCELFNLDPDRGEKTYLKVRDSIQPVILQTNDVEEIEEVVVKNYGTKEANVPGISGAAILGEGEVLNIIDVETLPEVKEE